MERVWVLFFVDEFGLSTSRFQNMVGIYVGQRRCFSPLWTKNRSTGSLESFHAGR
jgi:hypothetical protein